MTASSMTISKFLKIAPQLLPHQSVLIRGNHGIGKSQLARQVAAIISSEMGMKLPFIDRRLSQVTEGDIIGLPSTDGQVTRFNPPDWFKQACTEPCFLFLDELNRATPEVMQAAFQIVLDHELNGWRLHPKTRVFSAINSSPSYNVNEIDPALLDRFWVIDLNATLEDWLTWARATPTEGDEEHKGLETNVDPLIADFIASKTDKILDPPKNYDHSSKQPSRRSWDKLSQTLVRSKLIDDPNHDSFYQMCIGFIGTELSIQFKDFAVNNDTRVSGEEILNEFHKVKNKLARLGPERQNIAIEKLHDHIKQAGIKGLSKKQQSNMHDFFEQLPHELRISAWAKLTEQGTANIELAKTLHAAVVKLVMDVFGVPVGAAGVGILPNIPGLFSQPKK